MIGTGSIGAAAIGGAVLMSGSAVAKVGEHTFSGTEISETTDDGSLDDIQVWVDDLEISWEGLNSSATEATVELQVYHDGEEENAYTVDTITQSVSGTSNSNIEIGDGDRDLEGSIIHGNEHISADDFEASEDGDEDNKRKEDVTLELVVTVESNGDSEATGSRDTNLEVAMTNRAEGANSGGDAGAEATTYTTIGESDDEVVTIGARYTPDGYSYKVEIDREGWPANDSEANFNINLDFGVDEENDNGEDYQLVWHASGDRTDAGFALIDAASGDRGDNAHHEDEVDGFSGEKRSISEFIVNIDDDADIIGDNLPGDGESYTFAGYASDGGDPDGEEHFITADGDYPDWSDGENFYQTSVSYEE
ncbi:hypothetical protein [Natronorubrum texcoconense]|uniref:Uncharacterized protein n=1 Tax=Natronorubrum texcoconense TaxID=1095776 RepID=A0A1G9A3Z8_9EURY|nr:hypothetical protein [Natronorubrum texcoconense]SDK22119.1 hypothetical protein SAMN04515672_2573 [Natronorubrum texcoconense]